VTRARRCSLAVALALGALGVLAYPVWFVAPSSRAACLLLSAVALALAVAFARGPAGLMTGERAPPLLLCGVGLVLGGAVAIFAALAIAMPHGAWDAWSCWNLGARFLHRGGDGWTDFVASRNLNVTYPRAVSVLVATLWTATSESVLAPIALAFIWAAAAVAIPATAVAERSTARDGLVAAILVVSSERFLVSQAAQYADIPIAVQLVAALTLAADRSYLLAGVFAGFAAWTKNEGSLYLATLLAATATVEARRESARAALRATGAIALGALPGVLALLHWKHLVPVDYLFEGQGETAAAKLATGSRWTTVLGAIANRALFDSPAPAVALYLIIVGGVRRESVARLAVPIASLALATLGIAIAFVTNPLELHSVIDSSLGRVLMQLAPSAVFVALSAARPPGSPLDVRLAAR
jgi:hypothetical protein